MTFQVYIAGELIPASSLPDFKIEGRQGEHKVRITISCSNALSAAQAAACVMNAPATIRIVTDFIDMSYTGTVNGFGVRGGHSTVQLVDATGSATGQI
jgi:hypothetical protein